MSKFKTLILIGIIAIIPAAIHVGCGGSGGDGGEQNGQNTAINGTITNVVASSNNQHKSFKFSDIVDYLTFIKEARAQGGILVTAIIDGITVASDITDPEGDFSLILNLESATTVLLLFDINGDIVSIELLIEEGTVVNLTVSINLNAPEGNEVEIVELEEIMGAVRCQTGSINIVKNTGETLVIDGGGEDCIRTEGNCSLLIDPEDVILTNCEKCIDARGTSDVTILSPDGDIICDSFGDGIRAVGNAQVFVDAFDTIDITAGENGIQANGNSSISIGANTCIIDSFESTIEVIGNASVDTSGCGEVLTIGP